MQVLAHTKRGTRWLALGALVAAFWAFQAGQQDPKLDTTDPHLLTTAQYLYHFAKDNDWPEASKQGPFVIGVKDNPALVRIFAENYGTPPIGDQPLHLEELEDEEAVEGVHIFYTDAQGDELQADLKRIGGSPTLVMTRGLEALSRGVTVNLIVHEGLLRYELNQQDADRRGVLVGNRITSWAVTR